MYRSGPFQFLTKLQGWQYVCQAFEFGAGCLCWEYTISTDILKHSLYDLSPHDKATVRMCVPFVGSVDAGTFLASVFNFGGGRGKGRAQVQLVALRALVKGNSAMFVLLLIFVILTVLLPAVVLLWMLAMLFTFKFEKLFAAVWGSWQLLYRQRLAVASCHDLPCFFEKLTRIISNSIPQHSPSYKPGTMYPH